MFFYSSRVRARASRARAPRERVRRGRRKRAPWYTEVNGPGAVTGPGPLLVVRFTFDRPANVRAVGLVPATRTDTGRRRYCFGYS